MNVLITSSILALVNLPVEILVKKILFEQDMYIYIRT